MNTPKTQTRKERDRELREGDFLAAAENLFAQKGYHETSMEDVAKEAQYATGTMYRYFASKEELYRQLLARKGAAFFSSVVDALHDHMSPLEKLQTLLRAEVNFFFDNRAFMLIYLSEFGIGDEKILSNMPRDFEVSFEHYLMTWRGLLMEGMEKDLFRKLDVEFTMAALKGTFQQVFYFALSTSSSYSRDETETYLLNFLSGGLIKQQGEP